MPTYLTELMFQNDEILFDIYLSVELYFNTRPVHRDEILNKNLNRIRSLYTCFDVNLNQDQIKLYDDFTHNSMHTENHYYYLTSLMCFDNLNYHTLQILERSFSDIIHFWNHQYSGRDMDRTHFEIKTYPAGQRP